MLAWGIDVKRVCCVYSTRARMRSVKNVSVYRSKVVALLISHTRSPILHRACVRAASFCVIRHVQSVIKDNDIVHNNPVVPLSDFLGLANLFHSQCIYCSIPTNFCARLHLLLLVNTHHVSSRSFGLSWPRTSSVPDRQLAAT